MVILVVDQFRYDYLVRFGDLYRGGLKRLLTDGAVFANANYRHAVTVTCAGHAVVATGAHPRRTGIPTNAWWDREARKTVGCVEDHGCRILGSKGEGGRCSSPRTLLSETIGDAMKRATDGRSQVISISIKDSPAVLLGGHKADQAYWFEDSRGSFVTSDYYEKELPPWVVAFNSRKIPDRFFGARWERLYDERLYAARAGEDSFPFEMDYRSLGRAFPHLITGGEQAPGSRFYQAFIRTPFADAYLLGLAREAVAARALGQDGYPDLLAISLSALDLIGHLFGPYSHEVMDALLRLDKMLGAFMEFLERRVGKGNVLYILTSDHGVAPIPEYVVAQGREAGRVTRAELVQAAQKTLVQKFGPGDWVEAFVWPYLYLNAEAASARGVPLDALEEEAARGLMSVPGVAAAYTRSAIIKGEIADPFLERLRLSFYPDRSGDVAVVLKPYFIYFSGRTGTTHGSPYGYDTHVPVIFMGQGVKGGRYEAPAGIEDLAATLAALLGIPPPAQSDGRPLAQALSK